MHVLYQTLVGLNTDQEPISQEDLDAAAASSAGAVSAVYDLYKRAEENYAALLGLVGEFTLPAIEAACAECATNGATQNGSGNDAPTSVNGTPSSSRINGL